MILNRADIDDDSWNAFVEAHPHGWFWHTSHWLDYSLAYSPEADDLSFGYVDQQTNTLLAMVPLLAKHGELVHGGQVTPHPLFASRDPKILMAVHGEATTRFGSWPLPIQSRPGWVPPGPPPAGTRHHTVDTYVVDLNKPEAELWRNLRKSYKALIHRAQRRHDIVVLATPAATEIARNLHRAAAGRSTRSAATWEAMGGWTLTGHGIVAVATDKAAAVPTGFAYAIRFKDWAYYASGATLPEPGVTFTTSDDEEPAPGVSHALQWALMSALRCDGQTRYYEVGFAAGQGSNAKEAAIGFFKSGFGGAAVPVTVLAPASFRRGTAEHRPARGGITRSGG